MALEFYAGLIATGPRGALLADLNAPSGSRRPRPAAQRDLPSAVGETGGLLEVEPAPAGRS